jgi:hypothetical protein
MFCCEMLFVVLLVPDGIFFSAERVSQIFAPELAGPDLTSAGIRALRVHTIGFIYKNLRLWKHLRSLLPLARS